MGNGFVERFRSVLIFGPPGSGKGTQGVLLKRAGGFYHLSSGEMFRSLSSDSSGGKIYHLYAEKGKLLPDEVAVSLWKGFVQELVATHRYRPQEQLLLLDGIPRTKKQAEILEEHIDVQKVIVLDISSQKMLVERLKGRASVEQRKDDLNQLVLVKRMQIYQEETLPLLSHYPDNQIVRIDGMRRPAEVSKDILSALSTLLPKERWPE